jgi:membrane associated rhomboid family serine protease
MNFTGGLRDAASDEISGEWGDATGKGGLGPPFFFRLPAAPVSLTKARRADSLSAFSDEVRLDRSREPIFNIPAIVVAALAVLALVHGVRAWLLTDDLDRLAIFTFGFVPARYDASALTDGIIPGGPGAALWSFVTYALLHADLVHLGFNAVWLVAFGSPVARRFGAWRFIAFFVVTVAAGAVAHLLTHAGEFNPMIGASAAISGTMGAAARFAFQTGGPLDVWHGDRSQADRIAAAPLSVALRNPRVLAFLAVWFGVNLLFGVGSLPIDGQNVAWEAHVGGFLAGLLAFAAFDPARPEPDEPVGTVSN